jgi:homocysteine S-methyltransferase
VAAGARLVGGCCRVRPDDIAAVAAMVRGPDEYARESPGGRPLTTGAGRQGGPHEDANIQ